MIIKLCSEEEAQTTSRAVVGSRSQAVLQHVLLQALCCREHSTAQVAGETATASERVLYEVSLQLEGGGQQAATQVAFMAASLRQ